MKARDSLRSELTAAQSVPTVAGENATAVDSSPGGAAWAAVAMLVRDAAAAARDILHSWQLAAAQSVPGEGGTGVDSTPGGVVWVVWAAVGVLVAFAVGGMVGAWGVGGEVAAAEAVTAKVWTLTPNTQPPTPNTQHPIPERYKPEALIHKL